MLNLDEIEAQLDSTVPYYLPALVRELRQARQALAALRQPPPASAPPTSDPNHDPVECGCELSDMSAWAQAYRKAAVRQWLDARIAHWACVYRTGAGWIDAEHALIVLRAERSRLDQADRG